MLLHHSLLCLREHLQSIVISTSMVVCLSLCASVCIHCPRGYLRNHMRDLYTKFFLHVAYGRGSVLQHCCVTLYTSGIVDDITFLDPHFDRVDLIKPVSNVLLSMRTCLSTKSFFNFNEIWHVVRGR